MEPLKSASPTFRREHCIKDSSTWDHIECLVRHKSAGNTVLLSGKSSDDCVLSHCGKNAGVRYCKMRQNCIGEEKVILIFDKHIKM